MLWLSVRNSLLVWRMAQQPIVGPCSGFETRCVLRREVVSHSPKPQPGALGLCIYDPRRQDGTDISLGIE